MLTKTIRRKVRHSSPRNTRGRDRRAELRLEKEAVQVILHPSLFNRTHGVAA